MYVQSQEPIIVRGGVCSDQKVSKNASSAEIAMLPAPFRVAPKRSTGGPPDCFIQFPIDCYSRVSKECADKIFGTPWSCDQFRKYRRGRDEISVLESGFEGSASSQRHSWILVPQSDDDVRVDCGSHL